MKKILLINVLFISIFTFSQSIAKRTLEHNSVSALIGNGGDFFQDRSAGAAGYEWPKGSGQKLIYASGLWFAGKDQNDSLRVAAIRFRNGNDFFPGPVSDIQTPLSNPYFLSAYNAGNMWSVSQELIAYHIQHYNDPGYEVPFDISSWPANGDVSIGVASDQAPYVDVNLNNVYDPENGDYPLIRGDEAVYVIMNDEAANHTESGGEKLGIEVHVMAYQYATDDYLDSTTFLNIRLFNRGAYVYDSLYAGLYIDADVGFSQDDYAGSDSSRNMVYMYNGDPLDETIGVNLVGYGTNPPAVGVVSLNHDLNAAGYYNSSNNYPYTDPIVDAQYYNYLTGKWGDGSPFLYGGLGYAESSGVTTTPTNFLFSGDPETQAGWSEITNNNYLGDRRVFLSIGPLTHNPGEKICFDYAIVASRGNGAPLNSVTRIKELATTVTNFHSTQIEYTCDQYNTNDLTSYPTVNTNPNPPNTSGATYFGPELTKLSGYGNGNNFLELTAASRDSIVQNGYYATPTYKGGYGPVKISVLDSSNLVEGYYEFKLKDYIPSFSNGADTALWVIYRYDTSGVNLLDSVQSINRINTNFVQDIPQWGLSVDVHQYNYYLPEGVSGGPIAKITDFIDATIEYEDTILKWLTGNKDTYGYYPSNWIRSGIFLPELDPMSLNYSCLDNTLPDYQDYLDPCLYADQIGADPNQKFDNILDGIVAPHKITGYKSEFQPMAYYNYVLAAAARNIASISYLPSVDIVFTNDTSLWTKCPVIETGRDASLNEGLAEPGMMRKQASVDKNGNPLNDGTTGLGWFPGYAIDLESGARLYMAFGENSAMINEYGRDMIWNPTSSTFDSTSLNPKFGGVQPVYVFSFSNKKINNNFLGYDFPHYVPDSAENYQFNTLYNMYLQVEQNDNSIKRDVYSSISWVLYPLSIPGTQVLQTDATMKLRMNKEYKDMLAGGSEANDSSPRYSFNVRLNQDISDLESMDPKAENLWIYPNPNGGSMFVKISTISDSFMDYTITDMNGRIVLTGEFTKEINLVNTTSLNPGVYLLKTENNIPYRFIKH